MESIVRADEEDAGVPVVPTSPRKTFREEPYLGKRYIVSKDIG
jgi:hypothetical protein